MLVIRLARGGRKKYPVYRIVAADKRRAATGKFVAVLGNYNPHTKELKFHKEELNTYIQNGAQPSEAVLRLMRKDGIELPKWAVIVDKHRKPKKEPEAVEEKTEESTEAPETAGEEVATETHNIDNAEAEQVKEEAASEATETAADAAIETAQEENEAKEDEKPAE